MTTANAQCLCGDLKLEATLPSKWVAHCHCSLCRRAHGAAFVTWVGMDESRCAGRGARLLQSLRHDDVLPLQPLARRTAHRPGPFHCAGGSCPADARVLGRSCAMGERGPGRRPTAQHAVGRGYAPDVLGVSEFPCVGDVAPTYEGSSMRQTSPAGSSSIVTISSPRQPKPQIASAPSLRRSRPNTRSSGTSLMAQVM